MTLHYDVAGSGFPLLLLPGAAAAGSVWRDAGYVDLLQEHVTCVLVDPPGMGRSAPPASVDGYASSAIADAVVEICDELGLDRFAIWGASAGGSPALVAAASLPQRVAALLLSGNWASDDSTPGQDDWIRELAATFRANGARSSIEAAYASEGLAWPAWASTYDESGDAVANILEGQLADDALAQAPSRIAAPTLIIAGELEEPEDAERAAALMPNARVAVLPGLGHIGAWPEAPDLGVAHVLEFLEVALRPTGGD